MSKYKTKECAGLDKAVGEMTPERDGVEDELKTVNDYSDSRDKKGIYTLTRYAEQVDVHTSTNVRLTG